MISDPHYEETFLLKASVEAVWAALTDPRKIAEWHLCKITVMEGRIGGKIEYSAGLSPVITGRVVAWAPYRLFSHTFQFTHEPRDPVSEVAFCLEPAGSSCRLLIRHSGFPDYNGTYRDVSAGWPVLVAGLQAMFDKRPYAGIYPKAA